MAGFKAKHPEVKLFDEAAKLRELLPEGNNRELLNLLLRLDRVSPVGEEEPLPARKQNSAFGAGEAAQIADIFRAGDEHAVCFSIKETPQLFNPMYHAGDLPLKCCISIKKTFFS
jgi:hypothetical protein